MLKLPKKKLYIARNMRYIGIGAVVLMCLTVRLFESSGWFLVLAFSFIALAIAGELWIRSLYKCPKCSNRLLPYKDWRGFEKSCPDYCPSCGERIIIEIAD